MLRLSKKPNLQKCVGRLKCPSLSPYLILIYEQASLSLLYFQCVALMSLHDITRRKINAYILDAIFQMPSLSPGSNQQGVLQNIQQQHPGSLKELISLFIQFLPKDCFWEELYLILFIKEIKLGTKVGQEEMYIANIFKNRDEQDSKDLNKLKKKKTFLKQ